MLDRREDTIHNYLSEHFRRTQGWFLLCLTEQACTTTTSWRLMTQGQEPYLHLGITPNPKIFTFSLGWYISTKAKRVQQYVLEVCLQSHNWKRCSSNKNLHAPICRPINYGKWWALESTQRNFNYICKLASGRYCFILPSQAARSRRRALHRI